MNRLSFVVVGPQRTGSSWLDKALRVHPGLLLPKFTKETFFFDQRTHEDPAAAYFARYFPDAAPGQLLGEVGPTYFHCAAARRRLKELFPDLRIVILVREPAARTFSLFRHEVAKGRSPDDLQQAIDLNPEIVESGRYALHCKAWQDDFGSENVLLLDNDRIATDPEGAIAAVFDFLGAGRVPLPEERREKFGEGKVPRFRFLAKTATALALAMRRAGLDRLVEAGKAMGLKKVFDGGDLTRLHASPDERALLERIHAEDCAFFRAFKAGQTR
ncbi:MAG: sulfotransferase [Parvibaculum sp.]|nr:sulfotransferase [Parvibaculum sp.]